MRTTRAVWICILLALIGLGISGYLAFLHIGLLRGELLGGAACGGGGAMNCHAVTGGPWGTWLGMPLALWGMLGYIGILGLGLLGLQSSESAARTQTLIFLLALAFVLADAALLVLMVVVIRFYCLLCLLTYAVNAALLVSAARSLGSPWPQAFGRLGASLTSLVPSGRRPAALFFWALLGVGVLATIGAHAATTYVSLGPMGTMRTNLRRFITSQPRITLETEGDPSLGAPGASLRIVEFSDFFCPACQRASKLNTIMFAGRWRETAFTFKHFPLDTGCNDRIARMVHPGACQVAAASECAHLQGKFWPFHDFLFEQGGKYNAAQLPQDARRLGLDGARFDACMASGQGLEAVKRDIIEAAKVPVVSTPTYVINGLAMPPGGVSPAVFEHLVSVLHESAQ